MLTLPDDVPALLEAVQQDSGASDTGDLGRHYAVYVQTGARMTGESAD